MKYTSTALFILASTSISEVRGDNACIADGATFDINGCDYETFEEGLGSYLESIGCAHDAKTELRRVYNTNALGLVNKHIQSVCGAGWSQVSSSSFTDVDSRFTNSFMNEYVSGDTFLNSKFAFHLFNFQQVFLKCC